VTTPALSKAERRAAKETVGDKITSGSLEIHFSLGAPILARPLYFHHVPKTAGTSFRAGLRTLFRCCGGASLSVPQVKHTLRTEGRWPDGLVDLDQRARGFGRVELFASHYTAMLADYIDDPIVSFVREPEAHRRSYVAFHREHLAAVLARHGVQALVERTSNLQAKSLLGIEDVPATNQTRCTWHPLADRVSDRFTMFRTDAYADAVAWLADEYRYTPVTQPAKKVGTYSGEPDPVLEAIIAADTGDSLWLDRMIYERIGER
jgi:hypothetical protein